MFTIDNIKCPNCNCLIGEAMQPENLEILTAAYEIEELEFNCFKCGYLIKVMPDVRVTYKYVL